MESIHKYIIELHALLHLFLREFKKLQRRGESISNFIEGEKLFYLKQGQK